MPVTDVHTRFLEEIAAQREREEAAQGDADLQHRRSVELWADAYDAGVSYAEIARTVGVTRGGVRNEVEKHRDAS